MPYILIAIAAVVALFVIFVATRSGEFRFERTAVMNAPAEACFEQVNDLRNWDAWTPWNKFDPDAKHTLEGPPAGVGAVSKWSGNNKIGEGTMTIVESKPAELVRLKLQFIRPMKQTNTGEFTFKSTGPDRTTVTWSMSGRNGFMGKAFHLFVNCEKMIGGEFENGLASMKRIVESSTARVAVASN
jgi:hypothetical protein